MPKHVFLKEARALNTHQTSSGRSTKIRSANLTGTASLDPELAAMTEVERNVLARHVRQSLNKERRKSASRAGNYDISRHISLYLTDKALRTAAHKNGPVSGAV